MRLIVFIFLRKPLLVFLGSDHILGVLYRHLLAKSGWNHAKHQILHLSPSHHVVCSIRTLSLVKMSLIFSCHGRTMICITTPLRHICLFWLLFPLISVVL